MREKRSRITISFICSFVVSFFFSWFYWFQSLFRFSFLPIRFIFTAWHHRFHHSNSACFANQIIWRIAVWSFDILRIEYRFIFNSFRFRNILCYSLVTSIRDIQLALFYYEQMIALLCLWYGRLVVCLLSTTIRFVRNMDLDWFRFGNSNFCDFSTPSEAEPLNNK